MDTLMEGKKHGRARPRLRPRARRPRPAAPQVGAWRPSAPSTAVAGALRRRHRRRRSSRRRSSASRVAKGISLDEIAAYINETALFRNQWQFRPDKRSARPTTSSRSASARRCAPSSTRRRPRAGSCPRSSWGYFPVNSDGNDLVVWTDDDRRNERLRFTFPRQRKDRHLCIADFFRSVDSGDADYAAFHVVTVGERATRARARAVRRRPLPGVPAHPRALGRDDRGARRALAPPHPRGVGLRRRGRPDARRACSASSTAARATRGATRRAPTSRTRPSSTSCSSCTASA